MTRTAAQRPVPDEARWLRDPAQRAAPRVWRETVAVRGGTFQATLRSCADGGCVVSLPALPQLKIRGVTCQHARIKAQALIERYLRELAAERRPVALPLAA